MPGATVSAAKYCSLPSSRVSWMRLQLLPRDPSAQAAKLRQHGALLAAVAEAHSEDAVGGWLGG